MTRKILIMLAAFTLLLGVPLTVAGATNPYTSVDGDCFGWTVINKTGDDLTVVHTNDSVVPVGADVPANQATFFASLYTGSNGSLAITLEFADGQRVDEGASRDPVCDPTTTTTSTTGGPPSSTTTTPSTSTTSTSTTIPVATTTMVSTTTTSTTSTTTPPATSTTMPPASTTTLPVPTTSSTAPPTSTSVPPTTPTIDLNLEVVCDNTDTVTGAIEQITSRWDGSYTVGSTDEFDVYIALESPIGHAIPPIEFVGLPSKGFHDNGPGYRMNDVVSAKAWVAAYDANGNLGEHFLVSESVVDCSVPIETTVPATTVTVVTDPPPVTEPPPPTTEGPPELPYTGMESTALALLGLVLLGTGGLAAWKTRSVR